MHNVQGAEFIILYKHLFNLQQNGKEYYFSKMFFSLKYDTLIYSKWTLNNAWI